MGNNYVGYRVRERWDDKLTTERDQRSGDQPRQIKVDNDLDFRLLFPAGPPATLRRFGGTYRFAETTGEGLETQHRYQREVD